MLEVEFAQLSDQGRIRDHNEDYLGHALPESEEHSRTRGWLFALADGVGGHEKGEVASSTAVESVLEGFRSAALGEAPEVLLTRLIQGANTRVYETGRSAGAGGIAMATTLVSCILRYDRAAVAHVGDSRCYLVRRGEAMALTRDHTVAGDQVRLGLMSAREAAGASTRHVLSRSLGSDLFVAVDSSDHQIFIGDVLVLCSDGLHGAVEKSEIAALTGNGGDLHKAAERLVALANQRDGSDNISVQIVRVLAIERMGMYRGRPYKLR